MSVDADITCLLSGTFIVNCKKGPQDLQCRDAVRESKCDTFLYIYRKEK